MNDRNRVEDESFRRSKRQSLTALRKKINDLLKNPEFVLLYVPRGGGTMRLVKPAMDPRIHEDLWVASGGLRCYALSHLWGFSNEDDKNNHMWDVGNFIRDENGDAMAPIPMRAEKRDTLLALLRKMPGYWWIDVLCARVKTPLNIMGTIYRCCKVCCAMIDCKPQILYDLSDKRLQDMEHEYKRVFEAQENQASLYREWVEKWPEELQLMYQLTQCRWLKRVWTWQEATLPFHTFLVPETSGYKVIKHKVSLSRFAWTKSLGKLEEPHITAALPEETMKQLKTIFNAWREIYEAMDYKSTDEFNFGSSASKFVDAITALGASTRTCMDPADYVYGVLGSLELDVRRRETPHAVWTSFLKELKKIIQRMLKNDVDRQWRKVPYVKSISVSEKAYKINLSTARNMADVYAGLLNVKYDDTVKQCHIS